MRCDLLAIALLVGILTLNGCQPGATGAAPATRPAATVDGQPIPMDRFEARLKVVEIRGQAAGVSPDTPRQVAQDEAIGQLVDELLIGEQLRARRLSVPADAPGREWQVFVQRLGGEREALAFITQQGFTAAGYRDFLLARLREVMLARSLAEARLARARERVQNGADFGQEALRSSDDEATARQLGDLGWFEDSDVPPSLWLAVRSLRPAALTGVIPTEQGFVVAQVAERTPGKVRLRVLVATAPVFALYQPESRPSWFSDFLVELRSRSRIDVLVGSQGIGAACGAVG